MTWTVPTPDLPEGPMTGPDRPMLEGLLAWHRATLLHVCAGLTGEQLAARPLPASDLSLLGLVRHLAKVERTWFRIRVAGQDVPPLFDPALGKDADFALGTAEDAERAVAVLQEEVREAVAAVAGLGFDHAVVVHGEPMSLRMVHAHMIGEYARHNGHADLLRQHLDGVTGR
jgi:hypothetical protein